MVWSVRYNRRGHSGSFQRSDTRMETQTPTRCDLHEEEPVDRQSAIPRDTQKRWNFTLERLRLLGAGES